MKCEYCVSEAAVCGFWQFPRKSDFTRRFSKKCFMFSHEKLPKTHKTTMTLKLSKKVPALCCGLLLPPNSVCVFVRRVNLSPLGIPTQLSHVVPGDSHSRNSCGLFSFAWNRVDPVTSFSMTRKFAIYCCCRQPCASRLLPCGLSLRLHLVCMSSCLLSH